MYKIHSELKGFISYEIKEFTGSLKKIPECYVLCNYKFLVAWVRLFLIRLQGTTLTVWLATQVSEKLFV